MLCLNTLQVFFCVKTLLCRRKRGLAVCLARVRLSKLNVSAGQTDPEASEDGVRYNLCESRSSSPEAWGGGGGTGMEQCPWYHSLEENF